MAYLFARPDANLGVFSFFSPTLFLSVFCPPQATPVILFFDFRFLLSRKLQSLLPSEDLRVPPFFSSFSFSWYSAVLLPLLLKFRDYAQLPPTSGELPPPLDHFRVKPPFTPSCALVPTLPVSVVVTGARTILAERITLKEGGAVQRELRRFLPLWSSFLRLSRPRR